MWLYFAISEIIAKHLRKSRLCDVLFEDVPEEVWPLCEEEVESVVAGHAGEDEGPDGAAANDRPKGDLQRLDLAADHPVGLDHLGRIRNGLKN